MFCFLKKRRKGSVLIEYVLIASIMVVAAVSGFFLISRAISNIGEFFVEVGDSIANTAGEILNK
jgi:Flp pilus assembly pilin Flp